MVILNFFRAWINYSREIVLGVISESTRTDLHLETNHLYRAYVKFCHEDGCFQVINVCNQCRIPKRTILTFCSPILLMNLMYRLPGLLKGYSCMLFKRKKEGARFSKYSPLFVMSKQIANNQLDCNMLNFNAIET